MTLRDMCLVQYSFGKTKQKNRARILQVFKHTFNLARKAVGTSLRSRDLRSLVKRIQPS